MNSGLAALIVVVSFVVSVFLFVCFGRLSECGKQFLVNTHCPRGDAESNFGRSVPVKVGSPV